MIRLEGYEWCFSSVLRLDFFRLVFSEKVLAISNSFFLVATQEKRGQRSAHFKM